MLTMFTRIVRHKIKVMKQQYCKVLDDIIHKCKMKMEKKYEHVL